jgi:ADP-heptose:LPS heptosyltransferase
VTPRRVFILRPDNLGDLVLFSGALRHLRHHWPKAHITLCVRAYALDYFAHCPHVDRVIAYDRVRDTLFGPGRLPWMPNFRGRDRLGGWLRRHSPGLVRFSLRSDLAILPILSPYPEYHECLRELRARERIGICGRHDCQSAEADLRSRPWYSRQWDASAIPWNFPELEATRQFLQFLGLDAAAADLWPEFWTTPGDAQAAGHLLPAEPALLTLGLAPGVSSSPIKFLPASWYASAVKNLPCTNLRVVLFGSAADQPLNREVAQALAQLKPVEQVLDLTGRTAVRELIECLRRCDFVLSQDSAALHLATALRKPVTGILGGGHFGRFYPWGDPLTARVINQPMDCYGCNWHCKYATVRCLQEIPPQTATHALEACLAALRRN